MGGLIRARAFNRDLYDNRKKCQSCIIIRYNGFDEIKHVLPPTHNEVNLDKLLVHWKTKHRDK